MTVLPETDLERLIVADSEWQEGAAWGDPRPGHPEGAVTAHIEDVLANIDGVAIDGGDRERLRFVALVHDTFKHRVDSTRPRDGENHHAVIARRFAERYSDDNELLEVIELHDEAFNAWAAGERSGDWEPAVARAMRLLDRLGSSDDFYLRFYRADNATGSKNPAPLEWFERVMKRGDAD
jgi:hypothetical protein